MEFSRLVKSYFIARGKFAPFTHLNAKARKLSSIVLGIETSCDDTGVAVVNTNGEILGEELASQTSMSVRFGGVIPSLARKSHESKIKVLIQEAMKKANIIPQNLDAVAATVKPGLIQSLRVGLQHAKELALHYQKPFIPIHHMEAHALTARMNNEIAFPFLVLLISGGHCLLVLGEDIDKWTILGKSLDESPGVAFDKVARRLKLRNLEGFENISGGQAIEKLASEGDISIYPMNSSLSKHKANFSFGGSRARVSEILDLLEQEQGIEADKVVPDVKHLCASFQHAVTKQLIRQTQKAMEFIDYAELIPPQNQCLVISGGVACNQYILNAFKNLCNIQGYRLFVPPPKLCLDNGVMIAWNGIERLKQQRGILYDPALINQVTVESRFPMGEDISHKIISTNLMNPKWVI